MGTRREVIFVGGTPFSGAEVVAELLASNPEVAALPAPLRVHSDPRGIPALLGGRIGLEDFVAEVRGGEAAQRAPEEALDAAMARFRASYADDPLDASRGLFWALVDVLDNGEGEGRLLEASPGNMAEAHAVSRLVPDSRFVHVVRDGRDVAAAALESGGGPQRMSAAVEWWADRLRDVERGVRGEEDGAPYAVPEKHIATVVLDELALGDREGVHRALLDRLSLGTGTAIPRELAARLEPAALGIGRWHDHAWGPGKWLLSRGYANALDELREEGNLAAEPLVAARERLG